MCADISPSRRAYYTRKTIPEDGRVYQQTPRIIELENPTGDNIVAKRNAGYRSKFELFLAKKLIQNKIKFEYEKKKITYVPKIRTYTPDFYIPATNIYIEAKGEFDKADRVKMALVKEQHKDLDIRMVFMNARNKIYKGSKTTYADWCLKHNYRWAEKVIPMEWLKNEKR
jgi:hypothetical protein